jgi:SAM-dependent methyltransferase
MYKGLKKILKTVIPKRILFQYEPNLRFVFYQFYKGLSFQCNVCNKKLRKFITLEDGDRLCPFCGSTSRARRLWSILNAGFLRDGLSILDFSPSRCLFRVLKNTRGIHYASTDLSGDFLSEFQYDMLNIDAADDKYDLLICYHVLEHIVHDVEAMKEIFRVLKKGGTCIIQTPFKEGDIYEDATIDNENERLRHFGQEDHVRIYSVNGLKDRMVRCGFQVDIKQFTEPEDNKFGFKTTEEVLVCSK